MLVYPLQKKCYYLLCLRKKEAIIWVEENEKQVQSKACAKYDSL